MIIDIIKQNIYLFVFALMTVEGPITTFIAGGLAGQGILKLEYLIPIAIIADVLGDFVLYGVGRVIHKITILKKFKYFSQQRNFLEKGLQKSPFLYMLIVKITPYLATPGLIFTGTKKLHVGRFLLYSLSISICVKIIYLAIGYIGSVSIAQLQIFLTGRKQAVVYIIIGIILLWIIKQLYHYLADKIRERLNEK